MRVVIGRFDRGGYIYRSCVHFLQFWADSLQNWRSPGSNVSKKIPSSVAALIPGRLPKNRLRRRKDGCFRVSGNARSRFLASNVHVRASVRSPGYPEAVGGYPGLIRCPDHPAVNAKPRFRSKEARNSKNQDMHGDDFGNAGINGGMSLGNP